MDTLFWSFNGCRKPNQRLPYQMLWINVAKVTVPLLMEITPKAFQWLWLSLSNVTAFFRH